VTSPTPVVTDTSGPTSRLLAGVVDAFTTRPHAGNPAAVVLVPAAASPGDGWYQRIAAEFGLSETAFLRPRHDGSWDLRWFTPTVEVALCGHATLAAAHWLAEQGLVEQVGGGRTGQDRHDRTPVVFRTRSGDLVALWDELGRVVLDLPLRPIADTSPLPGLAEALPGVTFDYVGATAGERPLDRNAVVVVDAETLQAMAPDLGRLSALPVGGLIATARAEPPVQDSDQPPTDILCRYFAPACGISEDPVTGSAYCTLVDHWAPVLGRELIRARQMSARGGDVLVARRGDRALVAGHAVTVLDAVLRSAPDAVPDPDHLDD
jgi:PhzF family phenazine biosynthesis protein